MQAQRYRLAHAEPVTRPGRLLDAHRRGADTTKGRAVMARRSLTSQLYRIARASATGRSIRTGNAGRRAKNIIVGRALGRAGVWRRLWKG